MRKFGTLSRGLAVGAIGAISIATAGIGVATAANGGSLSLGHSNTATKTTTLKDKKGTPLSLIGKKSKPPLKVNSSKLVKHLNAAQLGGLTGGQISSGSGAQLNWDLGALIGGSSGSIPVIALPAASGSGSTTVFHPVQIAATAKLAAGKYQANATVFGGGDSGAICYLAIAPGAFPGTYQYAFISTSSSGIATGSLTSTMTAKAGQQIGLYCVSPDTDTSDSNFIVSDALTASHVLSATAGSNAVPNATTTVRKAVP